MSSRTSTTVVALPCYLLLLPPRMVRLRLPVQGSVWYALQKEVSMCFSIPNSMSATLISSTNSRNSDSLKVRPLSVIWRVMRRTRKLVASDSSKLTLKASRFSVYLCPSSVATCSMCQTVTTSLEQRCRNSRTVMSCPFSMRMTRKFPSALISTARQASVSQLVTNRHGDVRPSVSGTSTILVPLAAGWQMTMAT